MPPCTSSCPCLRDTPAIPVAWRRLLQRTTLQDSICSRDVMEPAGKGGEATQLMEERPDNTDDNVEECPVCMTAFDVTLRRPRNLPCGHTFCTPCINGLKDQGQVMCPTCRVAHVVPEAGYFPISYTIEAFIRRLRGAALTSPPSKPGKDTGELAPSPVTGPGQKGPEGLSRPIRSMLQEQEAKILAAIRTCQEVQAQLDQYQKTLAGWGERQQNLEDRLQALVDQSKDARVLLRQEESKVVTKKEMVHQGEQQLHTLLQTLRMVATRKEAYEVVDDADHCTDEEGRRAEECQGMFPDAHTVTTINKVVEVSNAALEAATTVQAVQETVGGSAGATGDHSRPTSQESSITDKLEVLLSPILKTEDLRSLKQTTRRLLGDGPVFAIHQQEGRRRHARITLEDGRLYLHSLQDQPLLPRTVQMDEVVPAAPPCLVFLDLAWPGSSSRRVFIRLSSDTPRGRQFLLLCTGQRGPTYANTRLFEVNSYGLLVQGEYVVGGDYENNNGTGGAALLPNLHVGEYRESDRAGAVFGTYKSPATGAKFGIITSELKNWSYSRVFGDVVGGLEVVVAAAKHRPITEVTVVDCGVVL